MATLAQGQITLVDYTDGSQITGQLTANMASVQTINPDSGARTPSWSAAPNKLVITPFFRRSGTSGLSTIVDSNSKSASVSSINWYIGTIDSDEVNKFPGGTPLNNTSHSSAFVVANGTALYSGGPTYALQIKTDILKSASFSIGSVNNIMSIKIICEVIEVDPASGQYNTSFAEIDFSALVQGGSVSLASCSAPQGNIFKNNTMATLPALCTLYQAAIVDTTATYQWYVQESAATDDANIIAAGIPGNGWKKLNAAYSLGTTGYATKTLTIPASAVPSLESFMCIVTDTETSAKYFDTITFLDASDPYQLFVISSNGTSFKRGAPSTTEIAANLFQNNTQIDASGTTYNYTWTKKKQDGATDSGWTPTLKTAGAGNVIVVSTSDILNKATFIVEVSPK